MAAGAIHGALLRWQLELVARASEGNLRAITSADLLANLIGFCGSLTTFSSWMLELVSGLDTGNPLEVLGMLAVSLVGGLALLHLGHGMGRRLWPPQALDSVSMPPPITRANK